MVDIAAVRVAEQWSAGNLIGLVVLILLITALAWAVVRVRN